MKKILNILSAVVFSVLFLVNAGAEEPIRIGVMDYFNSGLSSEFTRNTLAELEAKFSPRPVLIENVPSSENLSQLLASRYDFLLASPSLLLSIPDLLNRRIAVKAKSNNRQISDLSVAGTVLVLKDRNDLNSWEDLKGKSVVATLPSDLGGWLSIVGEMKKRDLDADRFFSGTHFIQHDIPDIFNALLNRTVDIGFVNACRLEEAEKKGFIPEGLFKVIGSKDHGGFSCAHSTELYPDLTLIATTKCSLKDAKLATQALLDMNPKSGIEWISASDFSSLNDLFETLEIGPFAYLRDKSLAGLWRQYKEWFIGAVLILCFLLLNEYRLKKAVIKKTNEVLQLSSESVALQKKLAETRTLMAKTEQKNVVTNMSALVAHELKQPLSILLNHINVLKLRLNEPLNEDDESADSVEALESAAQRMDRIVNRVRNYATQDSLPHGEHDLAELIRGAIDDFRFDSMGDKTRILLTANCHPVVNCSAIEMRLLFLNLIKNAVNAGKKKDSNEPVTIEIVPQKGNYLIRMY